MPKLFVLLFLFICIDAPAQNDIISVKRKNGRHIKTFFAGAPIIFIHKNGRMQDGTIIAIQNDSVYVKSQQVIYFKNELGFNMVDTLHTYIVPTHYKDIRSIKVFTYHRFLRGKIGRLLMVGGAGYILTNVVNGSYLHQPFSDPENLQSLGVAAGAFGLGFIIQRFFGVNKFSRRSHQIVYTKLK
ncbi:MAG: hypothetical protein WAT19_03365 [Ferruginibacter sp.]